MIYFFIVAKVTASVTLLDRPEALSAQCLLRLRCTKVEQQRPGWKTGWVHIHKISQNQAKAEKASFLSGWTARAAQLTAFRPSWIWDRRWVHDWVRYFFSIQVTKGSSNVHYSRAHGLLTLSSRILHELFDFNLLCFCRLCGSLPKNNTRFVIGPAVSLSSLELLAEYADSRGSRLVCILRGRALIRNVNKMLNLRFLKLTQTKTEINWEGGWLLRHHIDCH